MAKNPLLPKKVKPKFVNNNKSAGILDDYAVRKNVDTREGTCVKAAVNDYDIVNKKYFDDNASAGLWETTGGHVSLIASDDVLMKTTEKIQFRDTAIYLQSDSDGYLKVEADTGVKINDFQFESDGDIKCLSANAIDLYPDNQTTIGFRIAEDGTNLELSGLGTSLIEVGDVMKTTTDQDSNDTEYFANILYGTDSTPPAANTVPRGTIYLQYTA